MLISIITVNYNDSTGLERTIKSVREQTAQNVEHIIIDGDSTDGSKELIEKYKDGFSYWVSEPDKGIYHAMNKGIAEASGDYLLFLNGGDHFCDTGSLFYLQQAAELANMPHFVYGNIEIIGTSKYIKTYPTNLTIDYFMIDSLPHPATLIKSVCFYNSRYDENLRVIADWKFFLVKIGLENCSYTHTNKTISTFYMNGISALSTTVLQKERIAVIKQFFPDKLYIYKQHIKKYEKPAGFSNFLKRILAKVKTHNKSDLT